MHFRLRVALRGARIAAWLLVAAAAQAGEPTNAPSWEQTGWGGGGFFWAAVYHPARDGVIYMAGDCCGVYKTEDHGRNWRIVNRGLASYGVYSLAVSRSRPETVYAATEDGLCKSVDGGEHWRRLPHTGRKELRITGERNISIRAVAVDPADDSTVYAASPGGKVYKSADGGETWTVAYEKPAPQEENGALRIQFGQINGEYYGDFALPVAFPAGVKPADVVGIGFALKGDGTLPKDSFLMLKTGSGIVYRSRNINSLHKETEWRDVVLKAGDFVLDPDYAKQHPEAAAAPFTGPDWSAVVRLDLACSGALPTEATVDKFTRFFWAATADEAGAPAPPDKPRLVTFRDLGQDPSMQTFGNLHVGPPLAGPIHSVAVAAANPSRVIAATEDSGLVLSLDAGRTWKTLATPRQAACATFDPANADVIYGAFFTNGIMKSDDGGKTWSRCSRGISSKQAILEVAVSPANPREISAIGSESWSGAFYLSSDGGLSWKDSSTLAVDARGNPTLDGVNTGHAHLSAPKNLAINPLNPKEIFVGANWRSCLSTNGGLAWTERDRGADISCVTDIRFFKGKTYVTAMDEGAFVSEDDGRTWRQLWPLRHTPGLSGHNWRIAVNEVNGADRIVATVTPWYKTPTSVVRSDDGGRTFQATQAGLPDYTIRPNTMWGQGHPRALAVDPNYVRVLYLGIDGDPADGKCGGGIFKSQDGGATWAQLPHQPASRRMFYGLAVDPTDSRRIYWGACGSGGGVHRSEDGGASWINVFRNENYIWNVLATTSGVVYASGQQLWRSADHGATWQQVTHFAEKRSLVGIEVHPDDPRVLWVSAVTWSSRADGAVYRTNDGGVTWQDITGDLPFVMPEILRFNPDTHELWAGWVGLFKMRQ